MAEPKANPMTDWIDTPAEVLVIISIFTAILAGLAWVIKAQIAMQKEFKPNGGSSTRDQLNRIENKIDGHISWHLDRKDG